MAARLPGGDGPAGNVAVTGETDQCLLAYGDVMDTGGIATGDQIAGLQRAPTLGRTGQREGIRGAQATRQQGGATGTHHFAFDAGFGAQVGIIQPGADELRPFLPH